MKNINLAVVWFANGITGYVYKTNDTMETVTKPDYFEPIKNISQIGDQMYVVASDGVKLFYVKSLKPFELKEL